MNRKIREEMNELSLKVFGTTSKWKKILENGTIDVLERDREVMVPTRKGITMKVFKDRKTVTKYYTFDEVRKIMEDVLTDRAAQRAAFEARYPELGKGEDLLSGKIVTGSGVPEGTAVK